MKRLLILLYISCLAATTAWGQAEKVKNQPYADMKLYHFGFHVGLHTQDLILTNTGLTNDGETWFAEIPSYAPGFSVGVIGSLFLNPYLDLRVSPTLHFGDKNFIFREQTTGEQFKTTVRSSYVTLPVDFKYTALRLNNYRPYITAGVYGALDVGRKRGNTLLLKGTDFGVAVGFGCDLYLPFFKLCPEIKFCFGLTNLLEKDRGDLIDKDLMKYTDALSKATSRMIVLTFNFE